ncbi:MAG: hypothetical protein GX294_00060 [Candidatus Cloacimonetes bacterium]|nr:hypothetical protein [Candidatus Cloacimonadota bacterium]
MIWASASLAIILLLITISKLLSRLRHSFKHAYHDLSADIQQHLRELTQKMDERAEGTSRVMESMIRQLNKIQDPVIQWGNAQIANEAKKGEANRTLRRKNQLLNQEQAELKAALIKANTKIAHLDAKLNNATAGKLAAQSAWREYMDRFAREVQLIRSWISESGIPTQRLDSMLNAEFKGTLPSEAWQSNKDAARLSSAITPIDQPKQTG